MASSSNPSFVMSDDIETMGSVHAPGSAPGTPSVRRSMRLAKLPAPESLPASSGQTSGTSGLFSSPAWGNFLFSGQVIQSSTLHPSSTLELLPESTPQSATVTHHDVSPAAEALSEPSKSTKRARGHESSSNAVSSTPKEDSDDDEFTEHPPAKKLVVTLKYVNASQTIQVAVAKPKPDPRHKPKKTPAASSSLGLPSSFLAKREASGAPPVWSQTRAALCSTVPYFLAYQSGAYTKNLFCFGFLIDGDGGARSYIDDETIITRIGGGASVTNENGDLIPTQDQSGDTTLVKTLLNTKKNGIAVIVIIGFKHKQIGVKLDHPYSVMGHYVITDLWFEKIGNKSSCKIRLEKLNVDQKSWWAPKDAEDPIPLQSRVLPENTSAKCNTCSVESPQVFAEGWMCLSAGCLEHWKMNGQPPPQSLTHNPDFLNKRAPVSPIKPLYPLTPALPRNADVGHAADTVSERALNGIVCPQCSACVARIHWREWRCTTKECGYIHTVDMPILTVGQVDNWQKRFEGHAIPDTLHHTSITPKIQHLENYRKDTFVLFPGNVIGHLASNLAINTRTNGPDDMFIEMQKADMDLQRFCLGTAAGEGPTRHFTANYGMPYQYVVAQESKSFASAPLVVLRGLERMKWAGQNFIDDSALLPFNEMLVLGYFKSCKIGFHDDGETTLGPTIVTLSLGAEAVMTVRMKAKYYYGKEPSGKILDDDPALPGCFKYEDRLALKQQKDTLSADEYNKLREEVFKNIKYKVNGMVDVLVMNLRHGDMVVMHGAMIQTYYEHRIVPEGRMRFALTVRHVKPELIDPSVHHLANIPNYADEYDGN